MDNPREFIIAANDIISIAKHPVIDLMHKRIIRNYIINSKNASPKNVQHLNDTYFPNRLQNNSMQNILIGRHKKARKS